MRRKETQVGPGEHQRLKGDEGKLAAKGAEKELGGE